ncbi:uncharacterized protein M6B38_300850 [Iris pallida]|uniref:Uncharacterized protein n=1 Tax=Iris pallida TaxID=29817 RepID=A0AAX6F0V0_IRIPA|nr:uncharacterized protein M6B38_159365 [Iris pallida]KAJ6843229.1 uncharacterized protein M6B38_300850 [Iris pallida]
MSMISISSHSLSSPPSSPLLIKPLKPKLLQNLWKQGLRYSRRRARKGICRSELATDAPFVAAIGACVLTSLVSPLSFADEEGGDGGGAIDSTDARFAVMGIIGFIPYFNWMSWVFAWMDTGRQRYLVYAVVYLAPYLRTNLSLSPDESWLPIASILFCLAHIQLEVSITNGDLSDLPFLREAVDLFSSIRKEETQSHSEQGLTKEGKSNERAAQNRRDKFREWGIPRNSDNDQHHSKETQDVNEEENKSD